MSPQLTYAPAYLGLFAALVLGIACNAFLDIQYGSFTTEVVLWAIVLAWTLRIGWRQHGSSEEDGKQKQLIVLILGFAASILIFIPLWGFPRAGLYMLVVLQASQNCVTTTRRQLHFGLLVSAVMVLFATAHARADWTMLFYLVPYIIAVVLTLVAEQISRRAADLRQDSLGIGSSAGQGAAIVAATITILALGLALYLITPQVTWPYLEWRYGQLSNIGFVGKPLEHGGQGQPGGERGESRQGQGEQAGAQGDGDNGAGGGSGEEGDPGIPGHNWPSPQQMREAAKRPGMPQWQSAAIMQMADTGEAIGQALQPLLDQLEEAWNKLKEWLQKNKTAVLLSLFALFLLLLLVALYFLLREVKAATWLRTRFDFLRLGLFARHAPGRQGAQQYFRAMERLFALRNTPRPASSNAREYLGEITHYRDHIQDEAALLTGLFEASRYGRAEPDARQLNAMREAYRRLYTKLD